MGKWWKVFSWWCISVYMFNVVYGKMVLNDEILVFWLFGRRENGSEVFSFSGFLFPTVISLHGDHIFCLVDFFFLNKKWGFLFFN